MENEKKVTIEISERLYTFLNSKITTPFDLEFWEKEGYDDEKLFEMQSTHLDLATPEDVIEYFIHRHDELESYVESLREPD